MRHYVKIRRALPERPADPCALGRGQPGAETTTRPQPQAKNSGPTVGKVTGSRRSHVRLFHTLSRSHAFARRNLKEVPKRGKGDNRRTVVNEVSFVLAQEEGVGLRGRNGAGNTTTFRMILGMVTPDSGAVAFDASDITHLRMFKRARRGIGYLSQERSDFRRLSVWENLMAILETLSISASERRKRAERLLAQYGLIKQKDQPAWTLSGGERRKMEIARSMVTDPKLILLDEPFSGVDPIAVEDLQVEVRRIKDEFGKSVLITDHNVAQTLQVCDRALIINDSRVFKEGTPKEIINDPAVRSAYLGHTFRRDEFG